MKVYLTRGALAKGIVEVEASFTPSSGFVVTRDGRIYFKTEWFEKYDDAVLDFERQKAQRIVGLKEQIQKVRAKKPILKKERMR